MAINSYGIRLKMGESEETLEQVVCIKSIPDIGGTPEQLETTTLCDAQQTFIPGIKSMTQMDFPANYTKADYQKVDDLAGKELFYSLEFGENGVEGIYTWQGQHYVTISGAGVNSVIEMVISVFPSTEIKSA